MVTIKEGNNSRSPLLVADRVPYGHIVVQWWVTKHRPIHLLQYGSLPLLRKRCGEDNALWFALTLMTTLSSEKRKTPKTLKTQLITNIACLTHC